jgi:hypothetical protein
MACADYEGGQVFLNLGPQLQFAFVNLPDGVQGHEASPVNVSVEYVTADESELHPRTVRLSTSTWSVDLSQAPTTPPEALIIPSFTTADVCGNVFRSLEPVRFNRMGEGQAVSYEMVCP